VIRFVKRLFCRRDRYVRTTADRVGLVCTNGTVTIWFSDLGRGLEMSLEEARAVGARLSELGLFRIPDQRWSGPYTSSYREGRTGVLRVS
jgi:hypothetical protein